MISSAILKKDSSSADKAVVVSLVKPVEMTASEIQRFIIEQFESEDWFTFCNNLTDKLNVPSSALADRAFNADWTGFKSIQSWVEASIVEGGLEQDWDRWAAAFRATHFANLYSLSLTNDPKVLIERVEKVLEHHTDAYSVEEFHDAEINMLKKEHVIKSSKESDRRIKLAIERQDAVEVADRLTQENELLKLELENSKASVQSGILRLKELSQKHEYVLRLSENLKSRLNKSTDINFESELVRKLNKVQKQRDSAVLILQKARLAIANLNKKVLELTHSLYGGAIIVSSLLLLFVSYFF